MSPQSHAQQLLDALYRNMILRDRRPRARLGLIVLEPLPPRRLFSVTPLTGETLLNPTTTGVQDSADVAVSNNGAVVYAWANGSSTAQHPAVAIRDDGQYLLAWAVSGDIHAQLYQSNATPLGSEFIANSTTSGTQADPDVAMDSSGDFVITWDGAGAGDIDGVWARRFAPNGTALSAQFLVNTSTSGRQHDPAVAVADDGSFFIAYTDDTSKQILAQHFTSAGTGQGTLVVGGQSDKADLAAIDVNASNQFVITFQDKDSGDLAIFYRRYTNGVAVDPAAVIVGNTTGEDQTSGNVAIDASGNFVVAWSETNTDGDQHGIFARRVLANGTADGAKFIVNQTTTGEQLAPAIAITPGGIAVIAWSGNGAGDTSGVFGRQFSTSSGPNQAPVNSVPAAQTIAEDTSLVFSTANANAISISDPDALNNSMRVTLSATSGTLTLASFTGLTFSAGDGVNDATITFTGSATAINAALNGLNFTPAADTNGSATLSITTNDLGNTGSGGALTDTDSVTVNVTAVNDAPLNTLPPSQTISGGGVLNFGSLGAGISVTDVDAGSSALRITLSASAGTITLGSTAGLTFTTGNGSNDSTMVFTGTLSSINNALSGMSYNAPLILLGNANITITSNDLGNTGSGGPLSDTDVLVLGTSPANSAPVLTMPSAQTINEDATLVFSAAHGSALSVDDSDAGSGEMRVIIAVTNGTLTLARSSGLTFVTGDGISDTSMVFTGTLADLNNALEGMAYKPATNYNGTASLSVTVNDQGNSGSGGMLSDSGNVAITLDAVNDAPVVSVPAAQTVNEDTAIAFSSANANLISIADVDAGSGTLRVTLTSGNGKLSLSGVSGLSFTTGDGSADASMTFTGTLSAINTALAGMTFLGDANYAGLASIHVAVSDLGNSGAGGALTDSKNVSLTVSPVNDAPVNTVPATQSATEDTQLIFSAGNGNALLIGDVDANAAAVLKVNLSSTNGTLTLASLAGLTFQTGDGTDDTSITFTGSLADINAALNGLRFSPTANYNGSASIAIVTDDQGNTGSGGAKSDSDTVAINIAAVNDTPVNTVPNAVAGSEDQPLVFSAANGNGISVSDIDASTLRVTLHADDGTLTLASLTGLTFITGDGTADADLTFEGIIANLNAALDGLQFNPTASFNGVTSVQIVTNDKGQSGAGGAKSDTDSVLVTLAPANDAPTITIPTSQSMLKGTSLEFSSSNGNRISIADIDAGTGAMRLTITASVGTLSLNSISGLSFVTGDGTADTTMTFTGTLSKINTALNGLIFTPPAGASGAASIAVTINDQGNTGTGGAMSASATVPVEMVTEFRANTTLTNTQQTPAIAVDANGDFAVVWASNQGSSSFFGYGIFLQRYNASGSPVGSEIHVNLSTAGDQLSPAIAMDAAGNFVVAWASNTSSNGWEIIARQFDASGNPQSGEIAVNTTTAGDQSQPAVAAAPNGKFVVAWRSESGGRSDVIARRFKANGTAATGEIVVNQNMVNSHDQPAVAMRANNGSFTVAWRSLLPGGAGAGIFTRSFDGSGSAATSETAVDVAASGVQNRPAIGMADDGSFVIAWASGNNQDGSGMGVYGRRFLAGGTAIGGEFGVNTTTTDSQDNPTVAIDAAGAFTIAWASSNQDGSGKGVYAQKYDDAGNVIDSEFKVSGTTFGDQDRPAAAASATGKLAVVWQGNGIGDSSGVFGQFFGGPVVTPTNVVPPSQTTAEDTGLVFSTANGNAITVAIANSLVVEVSLTATHGLATLAGVSGLTFVAGDGTADATMTFRGTAAAINTALNGLRFDPDANFNGAASLQIVTTDLNYGTPMSDSDTVAIAVTPVNDAPTTLGIPAVSVLEDAADTRLALISRFSDLEDAAASLAYSVSAFTNPTLFQSVSIDASTHELVIKYAPNANGAGSITLRATDSGGLFAEVAFAVNVAPVDDAPVLASNGVTVDPGQSVVITTTVLQLNDVDNTPDQLVYTITALPSAGVLKLNGTELAAGDTFTQADIDAQLLTYSQQTAGATLDNFKFTASDATGQSIAPSALNINVHQPLVPPTQPPPPLPIPDSTPTVPPVTGDPTVSPTDVTTTDVTPTVIPTVGSGSGVGGGHTGETHSGGGGGSGGSGATPVAQQVAAEAAPAQVVKTPDIVKPPEAARPEPLVQKEIAPAAALQTLAAPAPVAAAPTPAPAPAAPPPPPAAPLAFIAKPDAVLTKQLDELHEQITGEQQTLRLVAGSASFVSLGLSVVYILWTIRAGYLLAGLLSSMPAWSFVDPLPILDHFDDEMERKRRSNEEDGESLETMVKGSDEPAGVT